MKVEKINDSLYRVLPEAGMHLTQSELGEDTRVFCCSAYELAEADASKWTEWTEEQKEEWEREHAPEPGMSVTDTE